MAERRPNPVMRIAFLLAMGALSLSAVEMAMRYRNWPPAVISGWRVSEVGGPVNQLGWRGHPWQPHRPGDFIVVLTGRAECAACPPDETLDLVLERALRQYNPDARVVTLSSRGYSQDQELLALHEYFAHDRADLVVTWASIADDVPGNMFRTVQTGSGEPRLKPTFAFQNDDIRGPTEGIGQPVYRLKLTTWLRPLFIDLDRNWSRTLPAAEPGSAAAPPGIETREPVDGGLREQRTPWAIWLTPRPARVKYGIDLTHALLLHMRELAILHGARFMVLLTPPDTHAQGPVALKHGGRWFVADPAMRDAAVVEVTDGLDTITLPRDDSQPNAVAGEQNIMARLAGVLSQHNLLVSAALTRPRH